MDIKGVEARSETNKDYDLFDPERQTSGKLLPLKQRLFKATRPFITKTFSSPASAALQVFVSFIQLFSLILAIYFPDNPQDDILLTIVDCFRVFTGVEVIGSYVLYCFSIVIVSIFIIMVTANGIFSLVCNRPAYMAMLLPPLYWAGMVPVTELLMSICQCDSDGKHFIMNDVVCWSTFHIAAVAVLAVIAFFWVLIMLLATASLNYTQHYRHDPFSHYPWNFEIVYAIFRPILVMNVRFVHAGTLHITLAVLMALYLLSLRWRIYPYYNPKVAFAFGAGIVCMIASTLAAILWALNIGSIMDFSSVAKLACATSLVSTGFVFWSQKRWYYRILTMKHPRNVAELDAKLHMLINALTDEVTYIPMQEALLRAHELAAGAVDSNAKNRLGVVPERQGSIASRISDALPVFHSPQDSSLGESISADTDGSSTGARIMALTLVKLYEEEKEFYGSGVAFLLQMSGVYMYFVKNMQLAYTTLVEAEALDPGIIMEFAIHLRKLELLTAVEASQNKSGKQLGYTRFERVIQFESEYDNLRHKMILHTGVATDFWSTLRSNPSLNNLHRLGLRMISLQEDVRACWERLRGIYAFHLPLLRIYKSYHKRIVGDKEEVATLTRQISFAVSEKSSKLFSMGELFSDRAATIIMSSDSKIVRASKSTEAIFLFDQLQLCGHYVTLLMPPLIGAYHQKILESYYKTGTDPTGGRQFQTFGMDRDGYAIPIRLAKKQFYSLTLGMLYIGAIETVPMREDEQYIITDREGQIGGITRELAKKLKLSSTIISEKKLNITKLCTCPEGQDILATEGEIVLKFVSFNAEGKISSEVSRSITRAASSSSQFLPAFAGQPSPELLSRRRQLRSSKFMCKCVITTSEHPAGLVVRSIKVGRPLQEGGEKKKRNVIERQMIQYVTTIFKAIRRFRALALRAKHHRIQNPLLVARKPATKVSCDMLIRGAVGRFGKSQVIAPLQAHLGDDALSGTLSVVKKMNGSEKTSEKNSKMSGSTRAQAAAEKSWMKDCSGVVDSSQQQPLVMNKTNDDTATVSQHRSASSNKERTLKGIADVRRKILHDFNPDSIRYLRVLTLTFMLLVMILLGARMGMSIWLNSKIVEFGPLMVYNGERISDVGLLVLATEVVDGYYPTHGLSRPPIATGVRESIYNYSYILSQMTSTDVTVSGYKDFAIKLLQHSISLILDTQYNVNKISREQGADFFNSLNGASVLLIYKINNKSFTSTVSLETAIQILEDTALSFVDKVSTGKYTTSDYEGIMIENNTDTVIVQLLTQCLNTIISKSDEVILLHNNFSLGALLAMVCVYVLYFVSLIPFLLFTSRRLEDMLMLFLEIPAQRVHEERESTLKFLKKVYKVGQSRQREIDVDNGLQFPGSDEDIKEEGEDDHGDEDEDKELNNDNEVDKTGEPGDTTDNNTAGKGRRKDRSVRRKKKRFVNYESNVWKVLFLFSLISCAGIGAYYALDWLSRSAANETAFKLSELRYLTRSQYLNINSLPYLYNYITSNKTGFCGSGKCETYLSSYFTKRFIELNAMLLIHKGNLSLLSSDYITLYSHIMEENPCTTTSLGKVFNDFQNSKGTLADIQKFSNDRRLIEMEVLVDLLLTPALRMLINNIKDALPGDLNHVIFVTVMVMSAFVVIFVLTTVLWLMWVLGFMRRSLFDTKSLLSNLPDDIILSNDPIYNYLATASASIDA